MTVLSKSIDLKKAFNSFEKIAIQLGGNLNQIQNDRNHQKFTKFVDQSIGDIESIFSELKAIDISTSQSKLFKDELEKFSELIAKLCTLREDMQLPYMLYVIGMGKAGKSSLLNSLVGSNVADVGTLPKTWKTDLFYKADHQLGKSVKIIFRDGTVRNVTEQDAKKLIASEEDKRESSEDIIDKEFKVQSKALGSIDEKRLLRQELADKYLYRSPIREVRWGLENLIETSVLNQFSLVDTPGLSQTHAGTHGDDGVRGEDIGDFYHHADGVLWVLDAMTLSASTPKEALENLENSLSHTHSGQQGIGNIIAVLNHADKVIAQGGEQAVDDIVAMAKNIFGNKFVDVVPYSAKQAVDAVKNNDSDLLQRSGYNRLGDVTSRYFYFNAVNLRIVSKAQGLTSAIATYQQEFMRSYLERLSVDHKTLKDRLVKAQNDVDRLEQQLIGSWKVKCNDYEKVIERNIESMAAHLVDLAKSSHAEFVGSNIINIPLFRTYISSFHQHSLKSINEVVGKYFKYDSENFSEYKYLKNNEFKKITDGVEMPNKFNSNDIYISIGFFDGILNFFSGRDRKIQTYKKELRNELKSIIQNSLSNNENFINELKSKASEALKNNAENAFSSLHAASEYTQIIQELFAKLDSVRQLDFQKESFGHLLFKGDLK